MVMSRMYTDVLRIKRLLPRVCWRRCVRGNRSSVQGQVRGAVCSFAEGWSAPAGKSLPVDCGATRLGGGSARERGGTGHVFPCPTAKEHDDRGDVSHEYPRFLVVL